MNLYAPVYTSLTMDTFGHLICPFESLVVFESLVALVTLAAMAHRTAIISIAHCVCVANKNLHFKQYRNTVTEVI